MTRLSYTVPENSTVSCGTTPKVCAQFVGRQLRMSRPSS
jgi:hypothetical protein